MAYVVKKGDNLTKIAKQNGLTLKQLLSLNKNIQNPDYIQIGQKINLPPQSPTGKPAYNNNGGYPTTPGKKNTPTWNRITKGVGNPTIVANFNKTPEKKAPVKKQEVKKEDPSFIDKLKDSIYEKYQDFLTALDQQTVPKIATKPNVKIDDYFIDYGYKELGTYKDQSFKAGKNDSLLSAVNLFDNDKGFDYIVSPKVKEGIKTYNNVKGVAHFLMDSDITPNQKYTEPYIEKGNNIVKSAQAGKFTPYLGKNPDDYVMYYKITGDSKMNVKYGQLKDKDKYKGYEQIKVRNIPFGELDFNSKKSAGFAKKASYIGTINGKQTSIITDPESNDVYGRFSGGSGIFHFKEPKTGKTISVDVSGSVNTIKQVGEELSKKYNVDPKQLQFLYHDMGSYSAKPKSHNGVLSNEQWKNYNSNNKGYSGAALMYPMEHGGKITAETIYSMSEQPKVILTPDDIKAKEGLNIDLSNTVGDRYVLPIQEFKNIVPDYQYEGYINSGIEGKYKNIDKTKYPVLIDKLQGRDTTFNEVQKFPWGGTPFIKNNMKEYIQSFTQQPLEKINMAGDLTNSALSAFAKPDSKASAYAEGSQMAQSVVKPLEDIPIVGRASKLISGIIGGALNARKQAIEDEEQDKMDKQTQYLTRNTQSVNQPSYYGQYMAKYGSNPKMMEKRIIDEIYSDFDKYLKLS